jgi:hypothetical protein
LDRLEPYGKAARWVTRGIDPFLNITVTFFAGIKHELNGLDDDFWEDM